jgi:hypothetical protein
MRVCFTRFLCKSVNRNIMVYGLETSSVDPTIFLINHRLCLSKMLNQFKKEFFVLFNIVNVILIYYSNQS